MTTVRWIVWAAALAVLAGARAAAASEPDGARPLIGIPVRAAAPAVDGRLDGDWDGAGCASAFIDLQGEWAQDQTAAFIQADAGHLYLGFRCRAPGGWEAQPLPAQSQRLFRGEAVEVFIRPDPQSPVYFHLAANPSGSVYTARCETDGRGETCRTRDETWIPDGTVAVCRWAGGWSLEARLPFAALGVGPPAPGTEWGLLFGRDRRRGDGSRGVSSWTGQGTFNAPARFGRGRFDACAGLDWEAESITPYEVRLIVRNNTDGTGTGEVAAVSDRETFVKPFGAQPGSAIPVAFAFPRRLAGALALSLAGAGRREVRSAFLPPAESDFSASPDWYYAPASLPALAVALRCRIPGAVKAELALLHDETRAPLRMVSAGLNGAASLDVAGIEPGRYLVRAEAVDDDGLALGSDLKPVFFGRPRALPPLPRDGAYSLDGACLTLNGAPFFPFMASATPRVPPQAGGWFNVRCGSHALRGGVAARGSWGLPGLVRTADALYYPLGPEAETRGIVRRTLAGGSRGVLFRNLRYEAQIPLFRRGPDGLHPLDPVEAYAALYRQIKADHPEARVSIHWDVRDPEAENLAGYARCADILELSLWRSSMARDPIRCLARDLAAVREGIGPDKPLILWIGASIPEAAARTADAIRCAVYLAVLNGVNGVVFHMGHDGIPLGRTRLWSVFGGLAEEVEFLYPLMRTGTPAPPGAAACDSERVAFAVRQSGDAVYVVAVNTGNVPVAARIRIGPGIEPEAAAVFESRSWSAGGGGFTDTLAGYEPRVYRLKRKPPVSE